MFDVALGHADAARLRVLQWFGPWARPLLVSREVRVAWTGALLVTMAFALTGIVPIWMLALGPIVWGVPHVVADLRYLALRPGYHRRARLAVPAVVALGFGWAGPGISAALLGGAACALLSRGSFARRAAIAAPLVVLGLAARGAPTIATLVFAHVHNLVAVVFFALWRRRETRLEWIPVALTALGAIAILGGALDGSLGRVLVLGSLDFADLTTQLAPPAVIETIASDPRMPARLVLLYAFGQSVHYVVWLRLIPEEERTASSPISFRQSFRALVRDVGAPLLVLSAFAAAGVAIAATHDLASARLQYLQLAFFHGWLEIIGGAIMLAEGRTRTGDRRP